jgi:HD-GYP domain-containing protein (c-di-GMP phosphodiesterase class II)
MNLRKSLTACPSVEEALARDQSILAHSLRLVRPAQATASVLGLTKEEIERTGWAALLHDLGKIAIPASILYKAAPLNEEEWTIMRRHSELGSQLLVQVGSDWICLATIVLAHHERWDGQGYPNGWAKEAIPIEARILSIADAYDAMTSPRVYRKSISSVAARTELHRCAGHQFDPRVVAAFLWMLDEQQQPPMDKSSAWEVHQEAKCDEAVSH